MHPTGPAAVLISGAGVLLLVVGVVVALALYFLPSIIAIKRRVVNVGSVIAINVLLGWSLIGWVVALAMALRTNPPWAAGPAGAGFGPGDFGPPTRPDPGPPPVG